MGISSLNAIAVLCAASAWLVTRRAPQHRPVAVALSLCVALDIARAALPLPARVDIAMCMVAPAASAWAYADVVDAPPSWGVRTPGILLAFLVSIAPWPHLWWDGALIAGYINVARVGIECSVRWYLMGGGLWTVTQRTAAMLLAGDVAGLLLLCRREWISYQAGAVLALVTGYQVWWLWRLRYALRSVD